MTRDINRAEYDVRGTASGPAEYMTTKTELFALVDAFERNPDGWATCDNLCAVLDLLPGQPECEFDADQVRDMIAAADLPE